MTYGILELRHGGYTICRHYLAVMNGADLLHIAMISVVPWGGGKQAKISLPPIYCHGLEKEMSNFVSIHPASGCNQHQDIHVNCNNRKPLRAPQCLSFFYVVQSGPLTLPFGLENSLQSLEGRWMDMCWLGHSQMCWADPFWLLVLFSHRHNAQSPHSRGTALSLTQGLLLPPMLSRSP